MSIIRSLPFHTGLSLLTHFPGVNFFCSYFYSSFGITPTMEKLHHKGVMCTRADNCQFVCIAQSDYYRILHQVIFYPCFQLSLFKIIFVLYSCVLRRLHPFLTQIEYTFNRKNWSGGRIMASLSNDRGITSQVNSIILCDLTQESRINL